MNKYCLHVFSTLLGICQSSSHAPTENADRPVKEQFYAQLEAAIADCGKNDFKVILGDFNAVTGTNRLPDEAVLGPWGADRRTQIQISILHGTSS